MTRTDQTLTPGPVAAFSWWPYIIGGIIVLAIIGFVLGWWGR